MNSDIQVSVIIPNYNYGHYLAKCINSVLLSDFDHAALEIIIVDDASTDDSINVIGSIKNNTKAKIHLIKHSVNSGLAKTRNTGIKNASGDYLFFLDSDNYIGKDCLKIHYDFLSKNDDYTACYAPIQQFDSSGKILATFSDEAYNYEKLLGGNYIDAMALIKKVDLIGLGLYDEQMPYNGWEDYELWLRMGKENKKIHCIEGIPLTYYRVHKDSMIHTITKDNSDKLTAYINKKFNLNPKRENNATGYTKIQIFWSDLEGLFFEKNSLIQFGDLKSNSKTLKFHLGKSNNEIEFIRFDIGEEGGLINIHSIIIKDDPQNIVWSWDKCSFHFYQDLFLLEDTYWSPDKILQISTSTDPWFIVKTNDSVKELSATGFSIEITLSSPDEEQRNVLQKQRGPVSFVSESQINILGQDGIDMDFEKGVLQSALDLHMMRLQDLDKENCLLIENAKAFKELNAQLNSDKISLNNDKLLLSKELHLKNDLIEKWFIKVEKLELQLSENFEKTLEEKKIQALAIHGYIEQNNTQKEKSDKIEEESRKQIELLKKEITEIALLRVQERNVTHFCQEELKGQKTLAADLQAKIMMQEQSNKELNNQIIANHRKIVELESASSVSEERNNNLTSENTRICEEINVLQNYLKENLKHNQELIKSVDSHLAYIEKLSAERKEIARLNSNLLDEVVLIKLTKKQLEFNLAESNKQVEENELLVDKFKDSNLMLKNQSLVKFIKGKLNK